MKKLKQGFVSLFVLIVVVVALAAAGGIGYKVMVNQQTEIVVSHTPSVSPSASASASPTPSAVPSQKQAILGKLEVSPLTLTAQISATIFAEILISDPKLIPQSVKLERLDENGNLIATLGNLRDDAQGGDLVANDHRYGIEVPVSEPGPGKIHLRVSAAFTGVLPRLISTEEVLFVLPFVMTTEPEKLLKKAITAFKSAHTVDDIRPFIDPNLAPGLQRLLDAGIPLSTVADTLTNAHLSWKTNQAAEFSTTTTDRSGELFRATIVIRKSLEGWKIVSL